MRYTSDVYFTLLALATINLPARYKIPISAHYKYIKMWTGSASAEGPRDALC